MLSAANSSTVGRQHRKSAPDIASSPFLSILAKCGLQMPEDSSSIVLVDSPYVFRQKLHHHLHSMSTQDLNSITSTEAELPEAIKQFISSLEDYVSEEENLKVCLRSVEIQGECERKGNESLIKILLGIDFIQVDIIQTLVERLVEYGSEDDVSNRLEESVPKLILGQLRWLEHIVNPELLTDLMVGLIAAVDLPLQQEIILALPEVIADSQHKTVARKLHDLLSSNSDLLVPILDTLIHLNTPEIISHEIRESVIERLVIADLNEIPVLLKFLLNIPTREEAPTNAEIDRAMQIIDLIRSKLNLEEISQVREQQTHLSQYVQGELAAQSEVSESLIFESLRSALRCHKPVREGWVKILDGVSDSRPFTQLDFFALLILNDVVPNQKRAKAIFEIFRRKISQGQVPLRIIEKCLKEHSEGLKPYQSAIVKLADFLLRSGGKGLTKRAKIAQYAKLLYQIGFEMFDIFHRQEIVAQLITHIGSNQSSEMDTSLETLLAIAQSNPKYLLAFQIFIKGVLENLDILGMSQLKILFEVFGILALQSDGGSSDSLHAELQILLRKQLQNPSYKKTGVLIATSLLKRYAAPGCTQENLQVVSEIGQMIEQFVCRKDPIALALYFDELSELVQSNAIAGEVVRAFLDDYSDGILDLMCERRSEDGDIFEVSDLENHFSQLAASVASNSRSGIPDENEDRLPYYVPKETYLENSKGGPMFALMGLISLSSSLPSQNYAGSSVVYLPALVRLYLTCHRFMREDGGQNQIDTVLRAEIRLRHLLCY
ncbi:Fanconi anaemia protein FancD2 nuclease-domain-containing protein [Paraphysoderma sedebokerense]|nr:Fanconi anaemia protein FancD2 nuclease-domain-containing protein [Paraphysoderma sedebokerense]